MRRMAAGESARIPKDIGRNGPAQEPFWTAWWAARWRRSGRSLSFGTSLTMAARAPSTSA